MNRSTDPCPFCGGASSLYVEVFGDTLGKCGRCGLVFLSPHPGKDEMVRRHQTKEYADHPYFRAGEEAAEQGGLELHHQVIAMLRAHLGARARLLDVGAGSGDFLRLAAPHFRVAAVEPSPYLARRIRERIDCPVFVGAFEDYEAAGDSDAVLLMDIIEHAADPRRLLRKAGEVLRPGGLLYVCTVDSDSLLYRLAPLVWRLSWLSPKARYVLHRIFCYQHNWYFNRLVLRRLVEEAGFTVLEHRGYEFPLNRLREGLVVKAGLRAIYVVQKLLGSNTEQYLLARKGSALPLAA
ncbi:MAG TPA: class I SAM-dependent methyltransferase [Gemmataceae bacterium]|nr:class I SAM-dependent methyltransferase [Gemmataceae bacterium]